MVVKILCGDMEYYRDSNRLFMRDAFKRNNRELPALLMPVGPLLKLPLVRNAFGPYKRRTADEATHASHLRSHSHSLKAILNMRLVCRDLELKSRYAFAESIDGMSLRLDPLGLQALSDIAKHPYFREHVTHLKIYTHQLNEGDVRKPSALRRLTGGTLSKRESRRIQLHEALVRNEANMRDSGTDQQSLTRVFQTLPNLELICISHGWPYLWYTGEGHVKEDRLSPLDKCLGSQKLKRLASRTPAYSITDESLRHTFLTTMSAIKASQPRLKSFAIFAECDVRKRDLDCDILDEALAESSDLIKPFELIEYLYLGMDAHKAFEDDDNSIGRCGYRPETIACLLSLMPNLKRLILAFSGVWLHNQAIPTDHLLPWPALHLTELTLCAVRADCNELLKGLHHSRDTLRRLKLRYVMLSSEKLWGQFLGALGERFGLSSLCLQQVGHTLVSDFRHARLCLSCNEGHGDELWREYSSFDVKEEMPDWVANLHSHEWLL